MNSGLRLRGTNLSEKRLRAHIDVFLCTFGNAVTRGTYERSLREFVRWFRKQQDFRFLVEDVQRYKQYLTRRKFSAATVSAYLTSLRRLCAFLVQENVLKVNPAENVTGSSRPRVHVRKSLTDGEVRKLIGALQNTGEIGMRDTAIVLMMLDCGLSESELVHMNVEDFRTNAVRVQAKGRTAKDESVLLTSRITAAVEQYLAFRKRTDGEHFVQESPLFLSAGNRTRGQRMSTRGIRDIVNNYLTTAGIKRKDEHNITPHSLRHTAARRLAVSGATPEEIRQRMRLGTLQTAKLYIKSQHHHTEIDRP